MISIRDFPSELDCSSHLVCVGCGRPPDLGVFTPRTRSVRFSRLLEGCRNSYAAWMASTEFLQKWLGAMLDKQLPLSLEFNSASGIAHRNLSCGFKELGARETKPKPRR